MSETATSHHQIIQLDTQLANQIAAGEVVERPASVVKELLENSLDAGASVIDVEVINGGKQLIRIRDNGSGIAKNQLHLALAPHATSKIRSLNDLEALRSYGFRGEALASISSVSKFSLTSKTTHQEQGWRAVSEGTDMAVSITPAPTTEGTRIDVEELFYNTPARRRFLRTDKTEFAQIEMVIRQVALANPHVAISLKHNQRLVKRFKAAFEPEVIEQRLAVACGLDFVKQSVRVDVSYESLRLSGWIGLPVYHRSQTDGQFFFVNHRPVKDKVLGHALREAYNPHLPEGRASAYVLFLDMPPEQVDVNVHPTKHEVRFHDVRTIHDFIVQAIEQCLHQGLALDEPDEVTPLQAAHHQLQSDVEPVIKQQFSSYSAFIADAYRTNLNDQITGYEIHSSAGQVINRLNERYLLFKKNNSVALIDIQTLFDVFLALPKSEHGSTRLMYPVQMNIKPRYRDYFNQLIGAHQIELSASTEQPKIMSAPQVWQVDYLGDLIQDYLAYLDGSLHDMNLLWVQAFCEQYAEQLLPQLKFKSLTEVVTFFDMTHSGVTSGQA